MKTNKKLFADVSYPEFKFLQSIERKAHKWAEDSCNYEISERTEARRNAIIERDIKRVFGGVLPLGFFINGDPRGYALKIDPEKGDVEGLERDWGGYGILSKII